jgi:putative phage-type endonuclease
MDLPPEQQRTPAAAGAGYFVAIDGETYGPYAIQEMVQYVREQKVLRKDLAWREGLENWTSVADIFRAEGVTLPREEPSQANGGVGRRTPKSRLGKLTGESIRQTTKSGDLPLHRGARNGTFHEIPRELLTLDLFLVQNRDGETALHVAAHSKNLSQIPAEFFTMETLSVAEKFGRTPLHIAAAYGCLGQLPREVLTPEFLGLRRTNGSDNSVVHEAARNNLLGQLPDQLLTRELMEQRNAYGETPLELLERSRATPKQLAFLKRLGVEVDGSTLTKQRASELIDDAQAGIKPTVEGSIVQVQTVAVAPQQVEAAPFTLVALTQGTAEWRQWRCGGIGSSDAPVIMAENPWKSSGELLVEKRHGNGDREVTEAMARGTELEPEARRAYVLHTGRDVQPACLQSNQYEWLRASVDGITASCDAVVEIKCGESAYRKTAECGRPPEYYNGQLQHILAVTGLPVIDFWCYLPGSSALFVQVDRDDGYIERLLWEEYQFWTQVLRGQ